MIFLLPYMGLLVALFFVYKLIRLVPRYFKFRHLQKEIPGPDCGFWFGQLLTIRKEPFMAPHKKWLKEFGYDKPLIRYSQFLGTTSLLVLDPDIIKLVMTSPASKDDCRFYKPIFFLPMIIGRGLVTTEGEEWMRHRRLIQPAFSVSFLKAAVDACVPSKATQFLQYWMEAGPECELDVASHLSALTLDVIGEAGFSYNCKGLKDMQTWINTVKEQQKENGSSNDDEKEGPTTISSPKLTDPLITSMTAFMTPNLLRLFFFLTGLSTLDQYLNPSTKPVIAALNSTVDDIVSSAKKQQQQDNSEATTTNGHDAKTTKSLLQVLLNASTDSDPKKPGLTDLELRDEMKTFLLAGHETTSTWCYWAMFALSKFPDVQEKLYQNIMEHAPADGGMISLEQAESMEYLTAFLQEVLRMYPPVGMMGRLNRYEEMVAGYTIPKQTGWVIPVHLLHRHPKYWDDPNTFKPERWMKKSNGNGVNGSSPASSSTMDTHGFTFLPFGAGGHNCIGYKFATYEAKLIMAHMVRAMRVEIAPSQRSVEHTFTTYITMKAKPGLRVVVKPRNQMQ